jgi:hypothetical protein
MGRRQLKDKEIYGDYAKIIRVEGRLTCDFTGGTSTDTAIEIMYITSIQYDGEEVYGLFNGIELGPVSSKNGDKISEMRKASARYYNPQST